MEEKVSLILKKAYGTDYFHPNCRVSRLLCRITRKKTLVPRVIECLKEEGFEIEVRDE